MILRIITIIITLTIKVNTTASGKEVTEDKKQEKYKELGDHTMVTDNEIFPYVVAILKKTTYISAGALIDDRWVLTAADSLFLVRESSRILRIRLGSINHKKGGILSPIRYFMIHPYFDDSKPQYDIALIRLPKQVRLTPNLNPIRLQARPRKVAATHFIVTGWQTHLKPPISGEKRRHDSMEVIKRRRLLSVSHLHPTDPEECTEQLNLSGLNDTKTVMCLDPAVGTNPCERQTGAPVVLNGILWGIVSSWKPEDCDVDPGPTFVTLVSSSNISSWIQATKHGDKWSPMHT
ncbi:trypsin-3-like [Epargyreus clarus]|uniref:trypsin-3-like n=1 Tax=Epargyreus clarus TaxID=520877 RepID=UPI003C2D7169